VHSSWAVSFVRFLATGWEGTGRVVDCVAPRHFLVATTDQDSPEEQYFDVTLSADGGQTLLVVEDRALPLHQLAEYGAGLQVHVEDLAAYLSGGERCDGPARWRQVLPAFKELLANLP
jgi:hypothetical protein